MPLGGCIAKRLFGFGFDNRLSLCQYEVIVPIMEFCYNTDGGTMYRQSYIAYGTIRLGFSIGWYGTDADQA